MGDGRWRPKSLNDPSDDDEDDTDGPVLEYMYSLVMGEFGPAWTIETVLDLTYPQMAFLANKGKLGTNRVERSLEGAMSMLRREAKRQGIEFDG